MICNPALKNVLTYLGSADLQSAAKEYAFPFWGITNPPVLIGRTFFTADCKSAGTPSGIHTSPGCCPGLGAFGPSARS